MQHLKLKRLADLNLVQTSTRFWKIPVSHQDDEVTSPCLTLFFFPSLMTNERRIDAFLHRIISTLFGKHEAGMWSGWLNVLVWFRQRRDLNLHFPYNVLYTKVIGASGTTVITLFSEQKFLSSVKKLFSERVSCLWFIELIFLTKQREEN